MRARLSDVAHDWLAVDSVRVVDGPEWARSTRSGLVIHQKGLAWVERRRVVVAGWHEVLGVTRVFDEVFLLVPRKPPSPPWLEVDADSLPEGIEGLDELVSHVRQRLAQRGYRQTVPHRPLMSPDQLLAALRADRPAPGTVEIPVGLGPSGPARTREAIFETAVGGVGGGLTGGFLFGALARGVPALAVLGATVGGAAALWLVTSYRLRERRGRILALAPDGCVIGLPEGVRALSWQEVAAFEIDVPPQGQASLLRVVGSDGSTIGAVDERWFSRPLELIVAVAETYRLRFADGG